MPKMKIGPGMSTVNRFIRRDEKKKKKKEAEIASQIGKMREEGEGKKQEEGQES